MRRPEFQQLAIAAQVVKARRKPSRDSLVRPTKVGPPCESPRSHWPAGRVFRSTECIARQMSRGQSSRYHNKSSHSSVSSNLPAMRCHAAYDSADHGRVTSGSIMCSGSDSTFVSLCQIGNSRAETVTDDDLQRSAVQGAWLKASS